MARTLSDRLTIGVVIVLVGVLLLLSTTGFVEVGSVWGWIAALFVVLGAWALVRSGFRNLVGPIMVIAIAGTAFLRDVDVIADDAISTWWPLFVILFGLLIVVSRSRRRRRTKLAGQDADEVTAVAVLGTDERRLTGDRFTGGELVCVLGDVVLDLRDVEVRTRPATVDTITVLGDTEIRVPTEWDVRVETFNVLGETIDRRPREAGDRSTDDEPELLVTGVTVLGDVEIRD